MTFDKFSKLLLEHLELPFDVEEVESVESNCGTNWITMKDGSSYYLEFGECEDV